MKYMVVLIAILLASCTAARYTSDETLIAEAVLRSLYGDNASVDQANKVSASLCINGQDPSPEFLGRFNGLLPTPLPCSSSLYSEKLGKLVKRGTAEPMISFSVSEIKLVSPTSATAIGRYYEAPLSSGGYSFKLSKVDGKWLVQEHSMDWIT